MATTTRQRRERSGEEGEPAEGRAEAATMPDRNEPARRPLPSWLRLGGGIAAGLVLSVGLAFGGDRALHGDQVLRGVTLAGASIAGATQADTKARLETLQADLVSAPLTVRVRDRTFVLEPAMIRLAVDEKAMLGSALAAGREGGLGDQLGWWLSRLQSDVALPVALNHDREGLTAILGHWETQAITDPPFEGAVEVKDGKAVARLPRPGFAIDRAKAEEVIVAALKQRERGEVSLPLAEVKPERSAEAVQKAMVPAKALLAGDITLVGELPPPEESLDGDKKKKRKKKKKDEEEEPTTARFVFRPSALGKALTTRLANDGRIDVLLDPEVLETALTKAREQLERPPVNAQFAISKKDDVSIVPSRRGRVIEVEEVAKALFAASTTDEREGTFPIKEGAEPEITTEVAEGLGIKGLAGKFTTRHPCCRPRVKNIHRIADLIDGVLLKPGERFSINEFVGERRRSNGFYPAPTIVLGEMKDTVGGGISQFATTFFNAAFYGAYEIIERQPHSFYFPRYPVGHEATLSFPKPDVIIRNDTEAGLLIRCFHTGTSITVKMYGDNGGRKVKRRRSSAFDLVDPDIEYEADDELDPEEEKVLERGKKGWSVNVSRTVIYPDGKEKKETRKVTYKPRIRKVRVHSCKIPDGEDGYTGLKCPEPEEDEDEDGEATEEVPVEDPAAIEALIEDGER